MKIFLQFKGFEHVQPMRTLVRTTLAGAAFSQPSRDVYFRGSEENDRVQQFLNEPMSILSGKSYTNGQFLTEWERLEGKNDKPELWVWRFETLGHHSFSDQDRSVILATLKDFKKMGLVSKAGSDESPGNFQSWRVTNRGLSAINDYQKHGGKTTFSGIVAHSFGNLLDQVVLEVQSNRYHQTTRFTGLALMQFMETWTVQNQGKKHTVESLAQAMGTDETGKVAKALKTLTQAGLLAKVSHYDNPVWEYWTVSGVGSALMRQLKSVSPQHSLNQKQFAASMKMLFADNPNAVSKKPHDVLLVLKELMGVQEDIGAFLNTPFITMKGKRYTNAEFLRELAAVEKHCQRNCFWPSLVVSELGVDLDENALNQQLERYATYGLLESGVQTNGGCQEWRTSNVTRNLLVKYGSDMGVGQTGQLPSKEALQAEISTALVNKPQQTVPLVKYAGESSGFSAAELRSLLSETLLTLDQKSLTGLELLEKIVTQRDRSRQEFGRSHVKDFIRCEGSDKNRALIFQTLCKLEKAKVLTRTHDSSSDSDVMWVVNAFGRKLLHAIQTLSDKDLEKMAAVFENRPWQQGASVLADDLSGQPNSGASGLMEVLEQEIFQLGQKRFSGQDLLKFLETDIESNFQTQGLVAALKVEGKFESKAVYEAVQKFCALGLLDMVYRADTIHYSEWRLSSLAKHLLRHAGALQRESVNSLGALFYQGGEAVEQLEAYRESRLNAMESILKTLLVPDKNGVSGWEILKLLPGLKKERTFSERFFRLEVHENQIARKIARADVGSLHKELKAIYEADLLSQYGENRWALSEQGAALVDQTDLLKALGIHEKDVEALLRRELQRLEAQKALQKGKILQFIRQMEGLKSQSQPSLEKWEAARKAALETYEKCKGAVSLEEKQNLQCEAFEKVLQAELCQMEIRDFQRWQQHLQAELNAIQTEHVNWLQRANQTVLKLNQVLMMLERNRASEELEALKQELKHETEGVFAESRNLTELLASLFTQMESAGAMAQDAAQLEAQALKIQAHDVIQSTSGNESLEKRLAALQASSPGAELPSLDVGDMGLSILKALETGHQKQQGQ